MSNKDRFQKILDLLNVADGEAALAECRKLLEELSRMGKEAIRDGDEKAKK